MPDANYSEFNQAVQDSCENFNMQCTPLFLEKVQQLYELIVVRHGVMLVGMPFGGKTTAYRVLAHALGLLQERVNFSFPIGISSKF